MTPVVAALIWFVGLVAWMLIRLPHQRRARRISVIAHGRSIGDRLALAAAGIGLSIIPLIYLATGFPAAFDHPFHAWMGWLGLLVEAAFLALFTASHGQLGRNWSVTLEIRAEHVLVTEGLYRFVRHPMYSSFWLWAIAQALLLPNWMAGLAGLAGVATLYFHRVGREEDLMRATFGAQYDAYAARTGRIVPRVF